MDLEKKIKKVKEAIIQKINPLVIFIYGSYGRQEFLSGISDIEIGVIKEGEKSVFQDLKKISEKFSNKKISFRIYSFHLEDLKKQKIDSPFTDSVFIRNLILKSKTIWGEKIIENLPLPPIDLIDAYREACSSTIMALAGLFLLRANKIKEGYKISSKACLSATASLEYLLGEFPIGPKNILDNYKKIELDDKWRNFINYAYNLRLDKLKIKKEEAYDFVYETIKYCNQVVEEKIKRELKMGNRVLIK